MTHYNIHNHNNNNELSSFTDKKRHKNGRRQNGMQQKTKKKQRELSFGQSMSFPSSPKKIIQQLDSILDSK